ncbi:MAG: acetylxylan esterase [Sedimentisphaerales bacterium]|nr:acetylxylan esterase [Sedimentisphaerales bacterium]
MTANVRRFAAGVSAVVFGAASAVAGQPIGSLSPDERLAQYFQAETERLADRCLTDVATLEDWQAKRALCRARLLEMLGLDPLPEKTPLKPVVTGTIEREDFTVERLHFQSRPGLYVTASLYLPRDLGKPAPAILYVCGHAAVEKDGVSYGNKTAYQHHAAWFARHGYVCLVLDTLQLGEIEGIHHGTYREGMWWWNSRGYTPAGVEAWNCVRALDYLQTRPEVDSDRMGVTGRSGGGAYSWSIAAIDERIKVAVPVAGITDLRNHVVDGCVEGHCDCMYFVNTFGWDYPLVAALVAPRPLLISNTDKDTIFPLDGVVRTHDKVRSIYRLYGAQRNLGLNITEGPHQDSQELRVHAFVWFNRFLKGDESLITEPAVPFFEPEQLRVFPELPSDQINTQIHESFVPRAEQPTMPQSPAEWATERDSWMELLREKVFRGWPEAPQAGPLEVTQVFSGENGGVRLSVFELNSQPHVGLRLYLTSRAGLDDPNAAEIHVLDGPGWDRWSAAMRVGFASVLDDSSPEPNRAAFEHFRDTLGQADRLMIYFAPRGIGSDAWSGDERTQTHIRRRFMLLGQTLDGMRVWDVRRALQTLHGSEQVRGLPIYLKGSGVMAGVALYASLFEPGVDRLELRDLPSSHRQGPTFLNVLRFMDLTQAAAMAAEHRPVTLYQRDRSPWGFPLSVADSLNWGPERLRVFDLSGAPAP